jgi:hypothetical protein
MTVGIDFEDVRLLVLVIFGCVGLMRGWYREGITSLAVVILALLVWQPAIANQIVGLINQIIKLIIIFVKAGFSLDPNKLVAQSIDPGQLLDPSNYQLHIIVMVVLLAASYLVGDATFKERMTPLGRLIGGILGVSNGYVILALVRQYMINYLRSRNQAFVAGTTDLSMQLQNVPSSSFFGGYGVIFVFVLLIGVIALLVAGDRLKLPLK